MLWQKGKRHWIWISWCPYLFAHIWNCILKNINHHSESRRQVYGRWWLTPNDEADFKLTSPVSRNSTSKSQAFQIQNGQTNWGTGQDSSQLSAIQCTLQKGSISLGLWRQYSDLFKFSDLIHIGLGIAKTLIRAFLWHILKSIGKRFLNKSLKITLWIIN